MNNMKFAGHPFQLVLSRLRLNSLRVMLPILPTYNKTHFNTGYE